MAGPKGRSPEGFGGGQKGRESLGGKSLREDEADVEGHGLGGMKGREGFGGGQKGREGLGGKSLREDEDDVEGHGGLRTKGE